MHHIQKPIYRNKLREKVGKEFFIAKRKCAWWFGNTHFAKAKNYTEFPFSVFSHKSLILRQLKDVDMCLQENKRTNLQLAIQHLNCIEIQPNETFSVWKLVGRPTKQKGYLDGLVLKNGTISKGIGGGLCQLGNLLFWIFAHSPLTITERYRHGFDVFPDSSRNVPFGAGATLSYNYIDLQVKNETTMSFVIKLWMDSTYLYGELFSNIQITDTYKIEERNHIIKQQMWGGYSRHNQIVQVIENEKYTNEKLLVENHAIMMYEPFLD